MKYTQQLRHWAILTAVVLLPGVPQTATAQATPAVPSPLLSDLAGVDLVSLRPDELLALRKDHAEEILRSLDARTRDVQSALEELRAAVEIKRREIDITKTQKDLADKQKREADKEEHERVQKRQEQERELLERQGDAAQRKLRFYDAQRALMRSQITAFDRERDLNSRIEDLRAAQNDEGTTLQEIVILKRQVSDLERTTLTALEKVAEAEDRAAERRRDFIRAQLRVVEARTQLAALGG